MNWKLLILTTLTLMLAISPVSAQFGSGKGHGPGGWKGGPPGPPHEGDWMQLCDGLNLTDEQETKIKKLKLAHQKTMMTLGVDIDNLRNEMKLNLTDTKYSSKKAKEIAVKLGKIREKQAFNKSEHMRAIRDILNDDQKIVFDQKVISGKFGKFGHGKGMMGGKMRGHGKGKCW